MSKPIITALSNDILDQIFEDVDQKDLLSLIKTHRVFHKSAQRLLFQSIDLPVQSTLAPPFVQGGHAAEVSHLPTPQDRTDPDEEPLRYRREPKPLLPPVFLPLEDYQIPIEYREHEAYGNVAARQQKIALFLQAIEKAPELAEHVRHVRIDAEWGLPLFVHEQATTIFDKLPNVRSIEVTVKDRLKGSRWNAYQNICMKQLWSVLEDEPIETVTLKTPTLRILRELIQIPTLKDFSIDTPASWHESPESDIKPTRIVHNWFEREREYGSIPNLTHFNTGTFQISPLALGKLLRQTEKMESLDLTLNCLYAWQRDIIPPWLRPTPPTPQTIIDVLNAFPSLPSTLLELSLLEPPSANFKDHPYPPFTPSFTFLKNLQILRVTSSLLYTSLIDLPNSAKKTWIWQKQDRCAASAYTHIPPSVRELEIQFPMPAEAVFATGEARAQFRRLPQALPIKGLNWISQFAEMKLAGRGFLTELMCLRLTEVVGVGGTGKISGAFEAYRPPRVVSGTFAEAGIELVIKLAKV
ncbi:hypothetical protein J4E93_004105 [Alternaria ventricosa]|uniref:uncharacterized protein n=1 Tax=Alternaria ventricosa TaxID=1187951 RepID=UPI0020C1E438|nr:uncharacterized protein J4E93_004105 [Alternaria ventricosa]KAI4647695.1 hypothetical protein J4E93_004105 [Alternaria ventricosa]